MGSRWGNDHCLSRVETAGPKMCTEEELAENCVTLQSTAVRGSEVPVQTKQNNELRLKTSPQKLPIQPSAPLSRQKEGKRARTVASVPELLQWTSVHASSARIVEHGHPRLQRGLRK